MPIPESEACACGRRNCSRGIRQDHLGKKHWRVHNYFECYELKDERKIRVWKKERKPENQG